jgi:uncharacterized protein (TIGR02246 family)
MAAEDPGRQIDERLQGLEDLEEIRWLFADYKRTLDGKDFAAYAELFASDGEFVAGELRAKGRAQIQALVEGMLGNLLSAESGGDFHVVANPSLRVEGDRASAELVWLYVVRGEGDAPVLAKYGHYEDELVRERGRWRFLRREAPTDIPAV